MKESRLQKIAKDAVTYKHDGYLQRAQSWKIRISSKNKAGHEKKYAVTMAESGTPDMVWFIPVQITPDMVGKTLAVFVGIETKKDEETVDLWLEYEKYKYDPDDRSDRSTIANQIRHKHKIQEWGGVYMLVSDPDEINDIIESDNFPFCHE